MKVYLHFFGHAMVDPQLTAFEPKYNFRLLLGSICLLYFTTHDDRVIGTLHKWLSRLRLTSNLTNH
jgi:hypothetical protein